MAEPSPKAEAVPEPAIDAAVAAVIADGAARDPFTTLFDLPRATVTRDGRFVVLAIVDGDGARGAQNLAIELRDRKDRTLERVVVLGVDEELDQLDDATRAQRAAAAHKLLAAHELVPLQELEGTADDVAHFEGAGITIDWAREHITIKRNGKRVVDRAVPTKWRGSSYYSKVEDLTCENPDFLGAALARPDVSLVVVDVAYRGNDTCWEPTSQLHVMSW
jgi:hypothetical protein